MPVEAKGKPSARFVPLRYRAQEAERIFKRQQPISIDLPQRKHFPVGGEVKDEVLAVRRGGGNRREEPYQQKGGAKDGACRPEPFLPAVFLWGEMLHDGSLPIRPCTQEPYRDFLGRYSTACPCARSTLFEKKSFPSRDKIIRRWPVSESRRIEQETISCARIMKV